MRPKDSGQKPEVFKFETSEGAPIFGCIFVFLGLNICVWVYASVVFLARGDWGGLVCLVAAGIIGFLMYVFRPKGMRKDVATERIELFADRICLYDDHGNLVASELICDIESLKARPGDGRQRAPFKPNYNTLVIKFQSGKEIFFHDFIDKSWKLRNILKLRTGLTFVEDDTPFDG